jgi:LacI family transcriptional regulator
LERILKSGIIRGKQRYFCKDCNYHFILQHKKKQQREERRKQGGPTSLRDIAEAAGVSITTVSRALNDHPDISVQTREQIKAIAETMQYQPNILAQSLVNRTTHTIGVIIPNLNTTFFSSMLSGIQRVAALSGYRVVICQSDENHATEIMNIQALMNNMIDGLLICYTLHSSSFEHLRVHMGKRIPIVEFYRVSEDLPLPRVYADDEAGAAAVTEHLIHKGCRRIALLLGPKNLSITQRRRTGYLETLKRNGLTPDKKLLAYVDFSAEKVIRTVDNWLKLTPGIDAIFSISDKSAVQIIRYLKAKKIRVPSKIRVVGFGNEYTGEIVEPQLSTYDVHTQEIGEEACRMLLEQLITGTRDTGSKRVPGKLIIRESA